MCRMFAMLATHPTSVECALVGSPRSLVQQSICDCQQKAHPDGWGIAWYRDGQPQVARNIHAASQDPDYSAAAAQARSTATVAHVRLGSVGSVKLANTHPFTHGVWTLAHNGTVRDFDAIAPRIAEGTRSPLRDARQGETDSEAIFYWLLSRMEERGMRLDRPTEDVDLLAELVGQIARQVIEWSAGSLEEPTALNLLVTDGRNLVATRWNRTLFWLESDELTVCPTCGQKHAAIGASTPYGAVYVASEPAWDGPWRDLSDGDLLSVDGNLAVTLDRF